MPRVSYANDEWALSQSLRTLPCIGMSGMKISLMVDNILLLPPLRRRPKGVRATGDGPSVV